MNKIKNLRLFKGSIMDLKALSGANFSLFRVLNLMDFFENLKRPGSVSALSGEIRGINQTSPGHPFRWLQYTTPRLSDKLRPQILGSARPVTGKQRQRITAEKIQALINRPSTWSRMECLLSGRSKRSGDPITPGDDLLVERGGAMSKIHSTGSRL